MPSPATPAEHIGRWLHFLRHRVNFDAVGEHAAKPVRILIGGPCADEFLEAVGGNAPSAAGIFARSAGWPDGALGAGANAAIYCRTTADARPTALPARGPALFDLEKIGDSDDYAKPRKITEGGIGRYFVQSFELSELRRHLLPDVAAACGGAQIALAAAVPAFRPSVAAKLTVDCALNSLKVAAVSAVADHVPVVGLLTGSIASAGDTIAITGMQVSMLLKMATAYGKKPEFARIIELLPVIGGGYGWRALARELSGFIPVAGIAVKACVAYAGTLVVGQAAAHYYETGSKLSPHAMSALYRESVERAKQLAQDIAAKFGPKKR